MLKFIPPEDRGQVPPEGFHTDQQITWDMFKSYNDCRAGVCCQNENRISIKIMRFPNNEQSQYLNLERETELEYAKPTNLGHKTLLKNAWRDNKKVHVFVIDKRTGSNHFFYRGEFEIVGETREHFQMKRCSDQHTLPKDDYRDKTPIFILPLTAKDPPSHEKLPYHPQKLPAIETQQVGICSKFTMFDGCMYRSRLEARYAVFLKTLQIQFTYELMTFHLPGGRSYTPDFYLTDLKLFIELKPCYPHIEEMELCEQVAALGHDIALVFGSDFVVPLQSSSLTRHYTHRNALRGILWEYPGKIVPGDVMWFEHENGRIALECLTKDNRSKVGTKTLCNAYLTAANAFY